MTKKSKNKDRKFIRQNKQIAEKAKNKDNKLVQQLTQNDAIVFNRITDVRNALSDDIAGAKEKISALDRTSNQFYQENEIYKNELNGRIVNIEDKLEILIDVILEVYPHENLNKEQIQSLGLIEEEESETKEETNVTKEEILDAMKEENVTTTVETKDKPKDIIKEKAVIKVEAKP
ncbi:MAG: hypothetical protein V3V19_11260 [Cocleimonas sp.]